MNSEWNSMSTFLIAGLRASRNQKVQRAQFLVHSNQRSGFLQQLKMSSKCTLILSFCSFFPNLLTIIISYQKGCFYLILFYSRIFSNSLLLFEFGVAGKISKYFIKQYHRLNLTTSFLISLLSKLRISAKQVGLLFVRCILFGPTTRALSAPSEPPFYSDSRIYPSLLQDLSKCVPMPESWLQLLLATPLLEMPLQWFSDFSKEENYMGNLFQRQLPGPYPWRSWGL